MTCQNVGPTNPDIAGLGIVIAFAFQAGLSLVLSCWSLSLWRSAHLSWITDIGPSLFQLDFPLFDLIEQLQQAISRRSPESKARRLLEILVPELKGHQDDDDISPSFWAEGVRWACKKRAIDKVLSIISDVQIMNVYETVSFTTSGATFHFLARIFSRSSTAGRLLPTTSGAALRPSSSSVPLISDNRFWARFSPVIGVVKLITGTGITSGLNVSRLVAIYFTVLVHEKPEYRVWAIVPLAMAQYPLHLYMTIALRAGNDSILSGDSENAWGFGQIVALILCAATLLECVKGFFEYRKIVQLQSDLEGSEVVLNEEIQARRRNSF
ncbi:hypothetical protein FSST1_000337 [Fusarium sambucinum]